MSSPTPWYPDFPCGVIRDANGDTVAGYRTRTSNYEDLLPIQEENARLIYRSVNAHAKLVAFVTRIAGMGVGVIQKEKFIQDADALLREIGEV